MICPTPYHQYLQTTPDAAIDWSKTPPAKHDSHVWAYYKANNLAPVPNITYVK